METLTKHLFNKLTTANIRDPFAFMREACGCRRHWLINENYLQPGIRVKGIYSKLIYRIIIASLSTLLTLINCHAFDLSKKVTDTFHIHS